MTLENIKEKYDIKEYHASSIPIPNLSVLKGIVLVVGSSGSGKSTILNSLHHKHLNINDCSIIEQFSSPEKGEELLNAFGLRTIPSWFRKINEVSNGERHRAECALCVDQGINIIDEFTSVVDRNTAKSLSANIRKAYDKLNLEVLYIASCHRDIIEWLRPDYIYDTDLEEFIPKESLRRASIQLHIETSSYEHWKYFKKHHYLDSSMSKAVHCYTAYIERQPVGFLSIIHGTGRDIRSYWRECRLVVIPEFQGLGVGKVLSETIATEYVSRGLRYFSKTAHPALGEYRNASDKWRGTSTNGVCRKSYLKDGEVRATKGYGNNADRSIRDSNRICYSHEFMGEKIDIQVKDVLEDWI